MWGYDNVGATEPVESTGFARFGLIITANELNNITYS